MRSLASERDKAEILRRVSTLRPDTPRRWGRMSSHQMVCHLSDGYRMRTEARTARLVASPLPRPVMKWIALNVVVRWPHGMRTTPELDQDVGGTRPLDFDADRDTLLRLIDDVASHRTPPAGCRHPIFGAMSEPAWLRWGYLHANHHLRQFGV